MVSETTNRHDDWKTYPIASHEAPPPDPEIDPIYFTKATIKLGRVVTYYGRTNRGTKWVVDRIWTFRNEKYGRVKSWMTEVRANGDIIEMFNEVTGERKELRFDYMASSVRYRLDEPEAERARLNATPNGATPNGATPNGATPGEVAASSPDRKAEHRKAEQHEQHE